MSDDQDTGAERLDEDVVGIEDDYNGDEFGDDLPAYPPERPMGVDAVGVTTDEEEGGESFAERTMQEVPEEAAWRGEPSDDDAGARVGQLEDPHAASIDHDAAMFANDTDGEPLSAEEAAMHIEPER